MADLADRPATGPRTAPDWVSRWSGPEPPKAAAGAAVSIVLREGAREVEALLIERTVREDDPASGQVALPGGHVDDADDSLRAAALRELEEEVGLGAADLVGPPRFVGIQRANVFGLDVAVFAALLSASPGPIAASPSEVAHVYWLPLSALDRLERVERATRFGPREVAASVHEGHVLWGFTLRVLREFFGRPPA